MANSSTHPEFYGIVDMGSNGIRFSITDLSPETARVMPTVFQDRAAISLYDAQFSGSDERGPIPQDTMNQVADRLVQFQTTCEDFGVPTENIHVLATEATRTAPNSKEFIALIKKRTGWEVRLLLKEDEGRIGAMGIASSLNSVAGLAMDLGGGSTQITWVVEKDGVVSTSPKGSFSFPYGAAALTKRLEQAQKEGKKAEKALKKEMVENFQNAYESLEVPPFTDDPDGPTDLYLCGGGFRGWGYVLMAQSEVDPYPLPIINGFRASRDDFHDTASVLEEVSEDDDIFGVSKRRASQIPAVAFLVNVIMDALPQITHIQFCQGGVREGFLFDTLPKEVRAQDPLVVATKPYAPPSAEAIKHLLSSALPTSASSVDSLHLPAAFSSSVLTALANLLFFHSRVPRESRAAAALHSTSTGLLASVNTVAHVQRALVALVLCERWGGDIAPIDEIYQNQLLDYVSKKEAWWCRYLGRVATLIGDVYPAGRVPTTKGRIQLETEWGTTVKKKEERDLLHLRVKCDVDGPLRDEILPERAEKIEKLGKKKHWIKGYGVKLDVDVI
ncbi:retrograde regulation protein 2 [Aspergillus steynii IBT 23096]|uniref:Retrograde regulation protein 2 n=1 Tax=Aspergillus steynii IBT 23096 TaxID=1392250 RepID=A0A2I2GRB8_9EURO|nr:retrograde regulation protein 2 [Aspergillus steynii IBT 23096]PLB55394.1 retrograde regulation protein 2 [Aspergillus steynii IBT 23096]